MRTPLALMKRAILPALGLLIIGNFAFYAVAGENGIMSWGDYRRTKAERADQLAALKVERDRLAHRARLLDPRSADPDLVDEMVRGQLGLVRPDEVIIELPAEPATAPAAAPAR